MHILWISKTFPFCGNVTYTKEISKYLVKNQNKLTLLHFDAYNKFYFHPNYSHIALGSFYQSQLYTLPSLTCATYLFLTIKAITPDIIHISLSLSPLDLILPQICNELKLPIIGTFHPAFKFDFPLNNIYHTIIKEKKQNTSNEFKSINSRLIFKRQLVIYKFYIPFLYQYSSIIVFSKIQFNLVQKLGPKESLLHRIPNGVDYKRDIHNKHILKNYFKSQCTFIYQGRISPEKNLEKVLNAWINKKMGRNCKLIIIGNGPLSSKLIPQYTAEKGIFWIGCINNELRKTKIISSSDIFLLSSLIEGLSLSLLESMSSQLTCLATNTGSDQSVLRPDNGILITHNNLMSQLENLLPLLRDNNEIRRLLSRKSRKKLISHYSLYSNVRKLTNLYNQRFNTFK